MSKLIKVFSRHFILNNDIGLITPTIFQTLGTYIFIKDMCLCFLREYKNNFRPFVSLSLPGLYLERMDHFGILGCAFRVLGRDGCIYSYSGWQILYPLRNN